MAVEQDHMNVTLGPDGGDEKLTAKPNTSETIDDIEDRENEKLAELIERVNNASSNEELDALLDEYLEGRAN